MKDIIIRKPQNIQPQFIESRLFHLILFLDLLKIMRTSIDLNHQAQFIAKEISNIFIQGFLTVKIIFTYKLPFQLFPKDDLRFGTVVP